MSKVGLELTEHARSQLLIFDSHRDAAIVPVRFVLPAGASAADSISPAR